MPPPDLRDDLVDLFRFGTTEIADYWRDQTAGAVDVSGSAVFAGTTGRRRVRER
jgi:hypothetical protein